MNPSRYPLWILAGGIGRRVGKPKGLIEIDGKPWLKHLLEKYKNVGGWEVWIGLGAKVDDYFDRIPDLPDPGKPKLINGLLINTVINSDWELGQFSTLCSIIQSQKKPKSAWVLPVDSVLPNSEAIIQMEVAKQDYHVVIPQYNKQNGHPVLLDPKFYNSLLQLPTQDKESRLDKQIQKLEPSKKLVVEVSDSSVLMNLNENDDWENLTNAYPY